MADEKKTKKSRGSTLVFMAALLFLSVVLAISAVSQFQRGAVVTGCVSVLGAVLFAGVTLLLISDLRKKRRNDASQEDSHE